MKKLLSILLTGTLAIGFFASCSGGSGAQDTTTPTTGENSAATGEPIKITYIVAQDLAIQTSYTTQILPEKLREYGYNVELEIRAMGTHDPSEWEQKFQLEVASGAQPPDIVQLGGNSSALPAIAAGWFAEIDEAMVEKYMPAYYAQVNAVYDRMWAWGKDPSDGKMYGIPSFNMFGPTRHTLAYRGDWLEKFDMDAPQTIEEFELWLEKCRTEDPNGNGMADEYGYTSEDADGYFSEVFGAFGIMPGQWMLRDGKIVRGDIQPEMKDALLLLRDWYSRDLIPRGVLTTAKRDNDFYAGISGTMGQAGGYAPAIVPTGSYTAALKEQNPEGYILGAPSFKGPDGLYGTWEWGPRKYILLFGSHLDEERIGYLMGMFETIASTPELFELTMLGERGLHWEFEDPQAASGATVFLEPYTDFNKKLNEVGVREMSESAWCPVWLEEVYSNYLDPLAIEYASQNPGYYDVLLSMPTPSGALYQENLNNITKGFVLDVITGKTDISQFDDFVKRWLNEGGEILTQEANEMYELLFR